MSNTAIQFPMPTAPAAPETPDHGKIVTCSELMTPLVPAEYAAGEVIGDDYVTFANCPKIDGGAGVIVHAQMIQDVVSAQPLVAELWLFTKPPTNQVDHAPFAHTSYDMNFLVAVLPFGDVGFDVPDIGEGPYAGYGTYVTESACCGISRAFRCRSGEKSLYGVLVAQSPYTPGPGEEIKLKLHIVQG